MRLSAQPGARRRPRRRAPTTSSLPAVLVALSLLAVLITMAVMLPSAAIAIEEPGTVWVTRVSGIIDPALSGYLVKTIEQATEADAAALIVEIDTPGGLDTAMRDIIQAELESPVPVVFYVSPQGARAASAGLFILMGADVAAMAPQTNLGSATPVSLDGETGDDMKAKMVNDAAAYIIGLAETHGRNADWAERAVREAVSLPAGEALALGVIDFVAPDLASLLEAIDGYTTQPKDLTLSTAGAPLKEVKMGWIQRFLHAISSPDIAYILLTIGIMGIILELSTPGLGAGGIVGVISLLMAFYAFHILPVSLVGVALVVLAMILFLAEVKVQSGGILGFGGAAALVAGGLLLFDTSVSFLRVSWPVLAGAAVAMMVLFMVVIRAVTKAMQRPPATGIETMAGATGVALTPLDPTGQVRVRGEIWRARVEDEPLEKGERMEVVRTEGLTLVVRRFKEDQ